MFCLLEKNPEFAAYDSREFANSKREKKGERTREFAA
jgi:hypothetical protein